MKADKRITARELRKNGCSMNEIVRSLGVSKSSVSLWVRDIELTERQRQELSVKGISKDVIERRRVTRLENEDIRRQKVIDSAKKDINSLSKRELFLLGVALYWAEGSKTRRGIVQFSNGDPDMIKVMMRFFKEICGVSEDKLRGYIHIHPHLDPKRAEKYWSSISEIPINQFYKTYSKPNKASKNKKDSLPYGTFDVYICNTELFLKLKGWREKIYELSTG